MRMHKIRFLEEKIFVSMWLVDNKIFEFQVSSIEQFALLLSNHFLTKYDHVVATKINIEEAPWKRMEIVSMI